MRVRFLELTSEAREPESLFPDTPVARFEVLSDPGGTIEVLAGQVSPFRDVNLGHWPARARTLGLLGLCAEVTEARAIPNPRGPATLDLANRFFHKTRENPRWSSLQAVDFDILRMLLRQALPESERPPAPDHLEAVQIPDDPAALLDKLESAGLRRVRKLPVAPSKLDRMLPIYAALDRQEKGAVLQLLGPYRERYLRAHFPSPTIHPERSAAESRDRPFDSGLRPTLRVNGALHPDRSAASRFRPSAAVRGERIAEDLEELGRMALHLPALATDEPDRAALASLSADELREGALWPGPASLTETLEGAEKALHTVDTSLNRRASDTLDELLGILDAWELRAIGLEQLMKKELSGEVYAQRQEITAALRAQPLAVDDLILRKKEKLASAPRPSTSAWRVLPDLDLDFSFNWAPSPFFTKLGPLLPSEDDLTQVAYGTSDLLTDHQVADAIVQHPHLKALYDQKLTDADQFQLPHRFDFELERIDPVEIRPKDQTHPPRYEDLPARVLHHVFPDGGRLYIFCNRKRWVILVRGDRLGPDDRFLPGTVYVGWKTQGELGASASRGEVVLHYMDERIVFDVDEIRKAMRRSRLTPDPSPT